MLSWEILYRGYRDQCLTSMIINLQNNEIFIPQISCCCFLVQLYSVIVVFQYNCTVLLLYYCCFLVQIYSLIVVLLLLFSSTTLQCYCCTIAVVFYYNFTVLLLYYCCCFLVQLYSVIGVKQYNYMVVLLLYHT